MEKELYEHTIPLRFLPQNLGSDVWSSLSYSGIDHASGTHPFTYLYLYLYQSYPLSSYRHSGILSMANTCTRNLMVVYKKGCPKIPILHFCNIVQKALEKMKDYCFGTSQNQDMPMICLRYANDIPEICLIYAPDMPEICPRYG